MECFTEVQWAASGLKFSALYPGDAPVVLRAMDLTTLVAVRADVRPFDTDAYAPTRVVECADLDAELVFPVFISLRGVPRLEPSPHSRLFVVVIIPHSHIMASAEPTGYAGYARWAGTGSLVASEAHDIRRYRAL